jgi:hypothetical protein
VDAVGAAVMGFDPAGRSAAPFEDCDSTLRLTEDWVVRDLKRIELIGRRISDLVFDYRRGGNLVRHCRMRGTDD